MKVFSMCLCVVIIFGLYSCHSDDIVPQNSISKFSVNFPNKINFDFSQISSGINEPSPYQNSLIIQNLTLNNVDIEYLLWNQKDENISFKNIVTIDNRTVIMEDEGMSDNLLIENSPTLYNSQNLKIALLRYNDEVQAFSGYYDGEINILRVENDSVQIFESSFSAVAWSDYQGQFTCFNSSPSTVDANYIEGRINSQGLFSGVLFNESNESTMLSNDASFTVQNDSLIGSLFFTYNEVDKVLDVQLKKRNR